MVHRIALLIVFFSMHQFSICSENYTYKNTFMQMDGRSFALGSGMNALEMETTEGLFITYILPYHLKELSSRSLKASHKTRWMDLEGGWTQTGDELFMENYLSLSTARYLSGSFRLKVKIGYYHYALITGDKGSTLLSEIGCNYKLNEKMRINVFVFNPTGSKINQTENPISISQSLNVGFNFNPVKKFEGFIEVEKVLMQKPILHLGLEYILCEELILRTGLSAQPFRPSWGFGGKINRFKYAVGVNNHPTLGFSSCFSLFYNW